VNPDLNIRLFLRCIIIQLATPSWSKRRQTGQRHNRDTKKTKRDVNHIFYSLAFYLVNLYRKQRSALHVRLSSNILEYLWSIVNGIVEYQHLKNERFVKQHLLWNFCGGIFESESTAAWPLRGEKLNYKSVAKGISKPPFWGVPEVQWASKFTVFVRFTFPSHVSNHTHIWYVTWPQ